MPETVVSKRIIRDHMLSNKLTPHTIEIDRPILLALKSAHQKYVISLEEEKKKKALSEAEIQAAHITTDID